MSKSVPSSKIALAAPETIPLDKLSVHEANVRQIKSGISIESLVADISRREQRQRRIDRGRWPPF